MNRVLWHYAPPEATDPYLLHARVAYPFRDLPVAVDDSALVESFTCYNAAPQDEHLIWYKQPVLFEPTYGFALTGPTTLLLQSMPYYERVGLPAFLPYAWQRWARRAPVQHERCVISLREFGDGNYYHFYSDVLGRLALLQHWPETADLPILISRQLHDRPYFQHALRHSILRERRWIVHEHGFVQAKQAIFCKVMPHTSATFDFMRDLLNSPPADPRANRRVFLTRQARRGRSLANAAEVAQVCAEFGFAQIDADQLDLVAQMACFATARYVIGIHGAGLVNTIFRRGAPLALLELFPPDNIPPHYFWICQSSGFAYDALVGQPSHSSQAFSIDPVRLRRKITAMLQHDAPPADARVAD